jgi:hypothetical protein
MMRKLVMVAFLAVVGCAPALQNVAPEYRMLKNYEDATELNAAVGDPLVSIEDLAVRPAYEAVMTFSPPGAGLTGSPYPIQEGMRFTAVLSGVERGDLWIRPEGPTAALFISINPDGSIARGWVTQTANVMDSGSWPDGQVFAESDRPSVVESRFKAQLLYGGTRDSVVRLTYREFADNFARPAFSQDLEFDLNESDTITFRSLRLQVIEAGNQGIRYRVLDDGGLPWWPVR